MPPWDNRSREAFLFSWGHGDDHDALQQLLAQVLNNPKMLVVVLLAALVVLVLGVILLVVLLPTAVSLLGGVGKLGLKGLIETIWLGTGK